MSAPDLLQTLKIIPQLHVQGVGDDLGVATVLMVLLPVQEPVWDLELARVANDHHQVLELGRGQLAGPGDGSATLNENNVRIQHDHMGGTQKTAFSNPIHQHLTNTICWTPYATSEIAFKEARQTHLLLMSTSAFLHTKLANRRPTPLMEVRANMIF
jgi:hypothetical protein